MNSNGVDKAENGAIDSGLRPVGLKDTALAVEQRGLESGAMQPMSAQPHSITDGGINFVVWLLERRGSHASGSEFRDKKPTYSEEAKNPFLPYDPRLFVSDISDSHVCLLNKYNILDRHLLIVTRRFEHQTTRITERDFDALWRCMQEVDGLAFYNGGKTAGASQRHKHLQLTPFITGEHWTDLPIAPALEDVEWQDGIGRLRVFRFTHAYCRLQLDLTVSPKRTATRLVAAYHELLSACDIELDNDSSRLPPYNLLATRRWMMVVPRSAQSYQDISVNALGFAGSLVARNDEQMRAIREIGPLTLLQKVGLPILT